MGSNEKHNQIVIQNGDRMRKWVVFAITVLLFLGLIATSWFGLSGRVDGLAQAFSQSEKTDCEKNQIIVEEIKEVKKEGTQVSRQNRRDIIAMKKDIGYTADMVKKIATKLNVN